MYVGTHHGGENREEEGGCGHIAGAFSEGADEETQDHGDGPWGD